MWLSAKKNANEEDENNNNEWGSGQKNIEHLNIAFSSHNKTTSELLYIAVDWVGVCVCMRQRALGVCGCANVNIVQTLSSDSYNIISQTQSDVHKANGSKEKKNIETSLKSRNIENEKFQKCLYE